MTIYYTVYQTTNLVNGRIYVGVHKTKNPNDEYLGSNRILKSDIKKYGRKNFVKEILFIFDNEEDMFAKEKELVNEDFISKLDTYNIGEGGRGWTGLGNYIVENSIGILSKDYIETKKSEVSRKTQIKLKKEKLGIYGMSDEKRSELGHRLSEHCRRYNKGIFGLSDKERSENGKKGSETCRQRNIGLFALTFEERSVISKKTQAERDVEERRQMCEKGGKIGGMKCVENQSGIHGLKAEERSEHSKRVIEKQRINKTGFFDSAVQSELGKRGGPKNKGFRWYNDGKKDFKYTAKDQQNLPFDVFLEQNPQYTRDRLKREFKARPKAQGKRTLTNGNKNIMLSEAEAEVFLINNPDYRYGRTNFKSK